MAGGKETPRQKMIGMMYLVLLAMLAMNVSKQIINAFVTLDSKLGISERAIISKNNGLYDSFTGKLAGAQGKDQKALVTLWMDRAHNVKGMADRMSDYLVLEASAIVKEAEGVDWHETNEETGRLVMKPLMDIEGKDKYDEPTRLFVGDDPGNPNERGVKLYESMHYYRDSVCQLIGTYKDGKKNYSFEPTFDGKSLVTFTPEGTVEDITELRTKFGTVNPADTTQIINIYKLLSLPAELPNHDETYTWQAAMFDHAPIVAAAAIFTSLKVDVRNAESEAVDFLLAKIDVPEFKFNKIEPLAFASTGYINQGDSLDLSVMIAAYDSTSTKIIRYGTDADTSNQANWKQVSGKIGLSGSTPGPHKVKGVIMVEKRVELVPKPWEFSYTVGAPMGVIAQPDMRILYWGYDNVLEGTASGFPADKVKVSGPGISAKGGGKYVVRVSRGTKSAKYSVVGTKDDGGSVNLGSFEFECRPMPNPTVYFGKTQMGGTSPYAAARAQTGIRVAYDPSVPLKGVKFPIKGGVVKVEGVAGTGKITAGGKFDSKAKGLLKQSKGKMVTIIVNYKMPTGVGKKGGVSFTVK